MIAISFILCGAWIHKKDEESAITLWMMALLVGFLETIIYGSILLTLVS